MWAFSCGRKKYPKFVKIFIRIIKNNKAYKIIFSRCNYFDKF